MAPSEPHVEPITGLVIAGTVIWASAYVAGVVASAVVTSDTGGDVGLATAVAAIPLVGPWIGFPVVEATNGNLTGPMIGGIIGVGLTQALGFTLLMVGVGGHEVDSSSSFQIVPTFGTEHGTGLSAVGTF